MDPSQRQGVASSAPAGGGARYVGSWALGHRIGSGSFAVVWKAVHKATGEVAAVKEIWTEKLNKKLQESLESEMSILSRTQHENIVRLLEIIKEKEKGRIYLVMEFCAGGDLSGLLRRSKSLPEPQVRKLMLQLAAALKELRSLNLIHRDLKPQNLLLSHSGPDATLKLADFGFARDLQPQGLAETLCGSPLYMAPEILQFHKYDAKADLWSVGAILFELIVGQTPFTGRNHVELLRNIERHEARLPVAAAARTSIACRQLIGALLKRNPVERIGFDEFFSHQFLVSSDAAACEAVSSLEQSQPASQPQAASRRPLENLPISSDPLKAENPLFLMPEACEVTPQRGEDSGTTYCRSIPRPEESPRGIAMRPRAKTQGAAELGGGLTTPSSTPVSTTSFMPSSLPRIQVAAIWDALASASGRSQRAVNAADQLCEQFSEPSEGRKLVQLEASASSGSLSDFERDFIVISSVPEEPPGNDSSTFSDGAHANAAIANATIGQAPPPSGRSHAGSATETKSSGPTSAKSPAPDSPPSQPPAGRATVFDASAAVMAPSALSIAPPVPAANQLQTAEDPKSWSQSSLKASAHLLMDLASSRVSSGAYGAALVLCDLTLQSLMAAATQAGAVSNGKATDGVSAAMSSAISLAQEAADALQKSGEAHDAELPCPIELTYRLAVDYGRAGAVNELMSSYCQSVQEYGAAITLLSFLLCEVPRMPDSGLRLPREFPPADERRMRRFLAKLQARCAACATMAKAAPSVSATLGVPAKKL